jgi:hypothetical protein
MPSRMFKITRLQQFLWVRLVRLFLSTDIQKSKSEDCNYSTLHGSGKRDSFLALVFRIQNQKNATIFHESGK